MTFERAIPSSCDEFAYIAVFYAVVGTDKPLLRHSKHENIQNSFYGLSAPYKSTADKPSFQWSL